MLKREDILRKLDSKFTDHDFKWGKYSNGALGVCPFHKDVDPSFSVYLTGTTWKYHCFGCGKRGLVKDLLGLEIDVSEDILDTIAVLNKKNEIDQEIEYEWYDLSFTSPWQEDEEIAKYLTESRMIPPTVLSKWNTRTATVFDEKFIYFPDKWDLESSTTNMYQRKSLYPEDSKYPRYWTSPGVKTLFHINEWNNKLLILVEGVIDAMRMYPYAVPVIQKGLTQHQELQLFERFEEVGYPSALIILFDGGREESEVSWKLYKRLSRKLFGNTIVGVGGLPDGKDPADVGLEYLVNNFDIVHLGRLLKRGGGSWLKTLL